MIGDIIGIDEECWWNVLKFIILCASTGVLFENEIIACLVVIASVVHYYRNSIDPHEESHKNVESGRHNTLKNQKLNGQS